MKIACEEKSLSFLFLAAAKYLKLDKSHGDVAVVRFDNPDAKVHFFPPQPPTLTVSSDAFLGLTLRTRYLY